VFFREALDIFLFDCSIIFEICLIAGDGEYEPFGRVEFELIDPLLDLLEALLEGDVVDDDGCDCIFVVDGGD
jgi:hypothetical protein